MYTWLIARFWLSSTTADRHLAPTWWVGGAQPCKVWVRPAIFNHDFCRFLETLSWSSKIEFSPTQNFKKLLVP